MSQAYSVVNRPRRTGWVDAFTQPLPQKLRINTRNRPSRCVGGCAGIRWARRTRPRASGEASIEAFFPFFAHFDFFSASHGRGSDGIAPLQAEPRPGYPLGVGSVSCLD